MESLKRFFDKFQKLTEEKILPVTSAISSQRHLAALRDGLTILIPLTVIGGISLMLANPPVDLEVIKPTNFFFSFLIAWKNWSVDWSLILTIPFNLTIGIISIYVVLGVSYRLAQHYKMEAFPNAITALFTFLCIAAVPESINDGSYINVANLGAASMFAGIIVALAVIEINHFMIAKNIKISMPDGVPPMVAGPFEVLLPMVINILLFIGLNQLCINITGSSLTNLVFTIFSPLISATSSLPSMLFIILLTVIFWFFGIHGDNMVSAITTPIFTGNLVANLEAYNAGKEIPNIIAGNGTFIFGLAIVYLAILFNLIFICKNKRLKSLGKLAVPSSLFNINEPLVFGVPTVLNILTFIPSLLCVAIDFIVFYITTDMGLMAKTCMSVPWTLPAPVYAFISTMDYRAIIIWLILFAINVIIFIPFMKTYDKQMDLEEAE